MAKRKRLNKRLVVLLSAFGVVLCALIVLMIFWFLPEDPKVYAQKGDVAFETGEYATAERAYLKAIKYAKGRKELPDYYYKMAKLQLEWRKSPELTETARGDKLGVAINALKQALLTAPGHPEAQRLLCELYWPAGRRGRERWAAYIKQADKLLALAPDDHVTYFRRAIANAAIYDSMKRSQDADSALADFRKASRIKPDEIQYWLGQVAFLKRLDKHDEVIKTFAEAIDANPDSAQLRVEYAWYLRDQQRNAEALQQIQEAIVRQPNNTLGKLALAGFHIADNKLQEAERVLTSAIAIDDTDYRIYRELARVYTRLRQNKRAAEVVRQGLAVVARRFQSEGATRPSETDRRRLESTRRQLSFVLANVLISMVDAGEGDKDKLLAEVKSCLEEISGAGQETPYYLMVTGQIALIEGKLAEAGELLERADKGFGGMNPQVTSLLIRIYERQNRLGKAEKIIERFLKTPGQENNVPALLTKATYLLRRREYDKAGDEIYRALRIEPGNSLAGNLALLLRFLKQETGKLPDKLELSGNIANILLDRASRMWERDQHDQAVELLEDLHGRLPESLTVIRRLAETYLMLKKSDQAKAILEKAAAEHPQNEVIKRLLILAEKTEPQEQFQALMDRAKQESDPLKRALAMAQVCRVFGKGQQHLGYLREAAKIDPDAPGVVSRMLRYAMGEKDWTLAQQWLDRAVKTNIDGTGGAFVKGQVAMAKGQYEEAITYFSEGLKRRPDANNVRILMGRCFLRTGDIDKAEEAFKYVVENVPDSVPAILGMVHVMALRGRSDEYVEWLQRAHRLAPGHPEIRELYLRLQEQRADAAEILAKIIPQRERMLARNPDDLENAKHLSMLYEHVKQYGKAETLLRSVYEKADDKISAARALAGFYARTNRSAKGDEIFEDLLRITADKVGAYIAYGDFLSQFNAVQSRRIYQKAQQADLQDPRGYLAAARFLARQGQWLRAAEAMEKCIRLRPNDTDKKRELSRYFIEAGKYTHAENLLESILAVDSLDIYALRLKGILMMRQGEFEKARDSFNRALQINPKYVPALTARAELHLQNNEPNKAIEDLQKARKLAGSAVISTRIAEIYIRLGEFDQAKLAYLQALSVLSNYAPAIDGMISLYFRQESWSELEARLAGAKKIFPDNPRYLLIEASMWNRRDRQDRRMASLEAALKIDKNAPGVVAAYLLALVETGQYAEALSFSQPYKGTSGFGTWLDAIGARAVAGQGKLSEADDKFASMIKDAPLPDLTFVVSQIKETYGLETAIEKLRQWVSRDRSKEIWLWQVLADWQIRAEDYAGASQTLQTALGLASSEQQTVQCHEALGRVYQQLGFRSGSNEFYLKAEKAYLIAIKSSFYRNNASLLNNLAYLYANDLGKPDEALKYAEVAVRLAPNNGNVLDTYGWALALLKRYDEAEKNLTRAVRAGKPGAALFYHLGWLYEQKEQLKDAEKRYRQGLELARGTKNDDPYYGILSKALERIRRKMSVRSGT